MEKDNTYTHRGSNRFRIISNLNKIYFDIYNILSCNSLQVPLIKGIGDIKINNTGLEWSTNENSILRIENNKVYFDRPITIKNRGYLSAYMSDITHINNLNDTINLDYNILDKIDDTIFSKTGNGITILKSGMYLIVWDINISQTDLFYSLHTENRARRVKIPLVDERPDVIDVPFQTCVMDWPNIALPCVSTWLSMNNKATKYGLKEYFSHGHRIIKKRMLNSLKAYVNPNECEDPIDDMPTRPFMKYNRPDRTRDINDSYIDRTIYTFAYSKLTQIYNQYRSALLQSAPMQFILSQFSKFFIDFGKAIPTFGQLVSFITSLSIKDPTISGYDINNFKSIDALCHLYSFKFNFQSSYIGFIKENTFITPMLEYTFYKDMYMAINNENNSIPFLKIIKLY